MSLTLFEEPIHTLDACVNCLQYKWNLNCIEHIRSVIRLLTVPIEKIELALLNTSKAFHKVFDRCCWALTGPHR